jgi:hypothetical protein
MEPNWNVYTTHHWRCVKQATRHEVTHAFGFFSRLCYVDLVRNPDTGKPGKFTSACHLENIVLSLCDKVMISSVQPFQSHLELERNGVVLVPSFCHSHAFQILCMKDATIMCPLWVGHMQKERNKTCSQFAGRLVVANSVIVSSPNLLSRLRNVFFGEKQPSNAILCTCCSVDPFCATQLKGLVQLLGR